MLAPFAAANNFDTYSGIKITLKMNESYA